MRTHHARNKVCQIAAKELGCDSALQDGGLGCESESLGGSVRGRDGRRIYMVFAV